MAGPNLAWERVLAAIEADTRKAAALLAEPEPEPAPEAPDGDDAERTARIPADWMLPVTPVSSDPLTGLPKLSDMPPVPEELRERVERLQAEIDVVRAELIAALAKQRQIRVPHIGRSTTRQAPAFVDRRL